jgi:hypothetical protein
VDVILYYDVSPIEFNRNSARWNHQPSIKWKQLPGQARDVGVGANGTAWIIGTSPVGSSGSGVDFGIYRWNGINNWEGVSGGAVRIAVGPDGMPWIVNAAGQIFHRVGNSWGRPLPGRAKDIGVGADGSVWIIGTNHVGEIGEDFGIYELNGANWKKVAGGAVRIAVGKDGMPWIVNSRGQIFRRVNEVLGARWIGPLPGLGKDIGAASHVTFDGPQEVVWLVGTDHVGNADDFGIFMWTGTDWNSVDGGAISIAAGPGGRPWVVNSVGSIFRLEER